MIERLQTWNHGLPAKRIGFGTKGSVENFDSCVSVLGNRLLSVGTCLTPRRSRHGLSMIVIGRRPKGMAELMNELVVAGAERDEIGWIVGSPSSDALKMVDV